MILPAKFTVSGTLKVKDVPAFYEWMLSRRVPWYRRVWNWIRWGDPGGKYSHTIKLHYQPGVEAEISNDLIDVSDELKGTR